MSRFLSKKLTGGAAFAILLLPCLFKGQTRPEPVFEAALVRSSAQEAGNGARSTGAIPRQADPTRIDYPRVTLESVIALAYGVARYQIVGPQWLGDERYDIVAKLPAGASQDQVPMMLQHLLTDRFAMSVHEETKNRVGYALVAGKSASRLKAAPDTEDAGLFGRSDRIEFRNMTLAGFAHWLSQSLGRPVADETGLDGHYDITLNASMNDVRNGSVSGAIADLGLKLETRNAPAKFVVVDKANRIPSAN